MDRIDELEAERDSMPDSRENMDRKFRIKMELTDLYNRYNKEFLQYFSYNDDMDLYMECTVKMNGIDHYYHPDIWK